MHQSKVWQFEIADNKVVTAGDNPVEIASADQKEIAKELLERWWSHRVFSFGETEYKLDDGDNERAVNRCLLLEQDAYVVDVYDITVFISFADLKAFAMAIRNKRIETMRLWDEKLAVIESGNKEQLLVVIQDLLALQSITPI